MKTISQATISGREAKGEAYLKEDGGKTFIYLENLWVSPGAPDVYLMLSPNKEGKVDKEGVDISKLEEILSTLKFDVSHLDISSMATVIIYCKAYSVHFGHGLLRKVD